jgi:hypothetical protein
VLRKNLQLLLIENYFIILLFVLSFTTCRLRLVEIMTWMSGNICMYHYVM